LTLFEGKLLINKLLIQTHPKDFVGGNLLRQFKFLLGFWLEPDMPVVASQVANQRVITQKV